MSSTEQTFEDRLYNALVTLHQQKHTKSSDCFCTTQISGVYKFLLETLVPEHVTKAQEQAAREAVIRAEAAMYNRIYGDIDQIINPVEGSTKILQRMQLERDRITRPLSQPQEPTK